MKKIYKKLGTIKPAVESDCIVKEELEIKKSNIGFIGFKLIFVVLLAFTLNGCLPKKEIKQEPEIVVKKIIAPVFAHGKGMGLAGDDVMIPHVFMTEDQARKIIENELKKTNIIFDKKDMRLKKIKIEKKKISFNKEEFAKGNLIKEEIVIGKTNLIIDGYCTELDLGYEFISKEDYEDYWQKEYTASVQGFDLKIIAEYLNKKLNEGNEINAVVFNDPLPKIDDSKAKKKLIKYQNQRKKKKYMKALKESTDKLQKKQKEEAVALLKEQVNDFIKWTTNLGSNRRSKAVERGPEVK